jgi:hypothetical protein
MAWIQGLKQMGVEVFVIDQLDLDQCLFEPGRERTYADALNTDWFDAMVNRFDLAGRAALIGSRGESLRGPNPDELQDLISSADALINVAGDVRAESIKTQVRRRVLVDIDPAVTQLWLASGRPVPRADDHDLYFTIGENIGRPGCPIPTGGVRWRHTRQPVLLEEWPVCETPPPLRFTTVARWRGQGPHGRYSDIGLNFADKADEFVRFASVAPLSGQTFEIALDPNVEPAETEPLRQAGWMVSDASTLTADPDSFRRYVQCSGAEFSVAKGGFVDTRSGWVSDRTTRYLASGKPALVQDTGFAPVIPAGDGLVPFATLQDAVAGAQAIALDYSHHAAAARQLAEDYFAAEVVLGPFIDEALGARI